MGKNIGRMQMRVFLEEFARRMPHIRLMEGQEMDFLPNTSFRGPSALWVEWEPAHNPERTGAAAMATPAGFYIGPPSKDGIARTVVVTNKMTEGDGLYRLVLADPRGKALPAWTAGSHVDLIAGGFRRKYSLCGRSENRTTFEVVIQREADGRGGSRHFCDQVEQGCELQLSGPKNLFRLEEDAAHVVLIAAGIGITPMVTMADRLKALGQSYEIHYAGRSRQHMALTERLVQDHADKLTLYVKAEGHRMDLASVLASVNPSWRVYACGPARLIEALESMAGHWPDGVLHFEHFNADSTALDPAKEHGFVAELKDSGITVTVLPGQTLLQALQQAGVDVPCDCGEGLCGTCEVNVVDGEIDHRDKVLSRIERIANTRMMACCSRAAGSKVVLSL
jgi:ferredoxin-NADP reductase